ncbi:MAG TPA: siderophore-interacting protein [Marmoricola sp.]|nr:siderophore-interacting protein [Marmoricola sp.]
MAGRAGAPLRGTVVAREELSPHLVRLVVGGLDGFESTGVPDEWVALTVPGQFQTRYYTVRSWAGGELTLDVVVHDEGLVTGWAQTECVGDEVGIGPAKGSYAEPRGARWVVLVGDLTALPAIARIAETTTLPVTAQVESPDGPLPDYLAAGSATVTWLDPPADAQSRLAEVVRGLSWPEGPGYFWMAGESAQMRDIRKYLRRDLGWDSRSHDVMGYWSGARGRQARAVDPGPIYRQGKAMGKSDEEIWADYDRARGGA